MQVLKATWKVKSLFIAMFVGAALTASSARAQFGGTYSYDYSWGYTSNLNYFTNKAVMQAQQKRLRAGKARKTSPTKPTTNTKPTKPDKPAALPMSACQFKPASKTPIMPVVLARAMFPDKDIKGGPSREELAEMRPKVEQLFTTLLSDYQTAMKNADQEWDTARAVGAFIMMNYYGATGRDLTFEQFKGLVQQVRAIWATDPDYRRKSAREKQESYEFLVIMGSYVSLGRTGAEQKKNQEVLKQVQQMAERSLRALFGVPSSKLRFTNDGCQISS